MQTITNRENKKKFSWNWKDFLWVLPAIIGILLGAIIGQLQKSNEDQSMRRAEAVVVSEPYMEVIQGYSFHRAIVKTTNKNGRSGQIEVSPNTKIGDKLTVWTVNGEVTPKQSKDTIGPFLGGLLGMVIPYVALAVIFLLILFIEMMRG